MKSPLTSLGIILFTSMMLTGCGKDSGGGGGGGGDSPKPVAGEGDGNGEKPGQTKDCDTQWKEKVANAPVGQVKAYDIVETTTGTGDPALDQTVKSRSRQELVSATDEAVVTKTRWEYSQPVLGPVDGEARITKETFMLTCEPIVSDPQADPDGLAKAGVTILIDHTESITVKAGTFEVNYQRIYVKKDDALDNEVMGDHWTMEDETVVVKEKIVVTSLNGDLKSTRTTERELVEYVAP